MAITYRTDGDWGTGKGSNLTAAEVDENFYDHEERIAALEATGGTDGVGISNITQSGTQLTVHLTDASTLGPFTLPQGRGWAVETSERTANFVLAATDHMQLIRLNNASSRTVTVPTNASVAIPVGTQVKVCRIGAGAVLISPSVGVTLQVPASYLDTSSRILVPEQYGTVTLHKVATDTWFAEVSGERAFHGALVYNAADSGPFDFSGGGWIGWDSEAYDTDGFHSTSADINRLTIPTEFAGKRFRVGASVYFDNVATGKTMQVLISHFNSSGTQKNDPWSGPGSQTATADYTDNVVSVWMPPVVVEAGDWFRTSIYCTDTAVTLLADRSWFAIEMV